MSIFLLEKLKTSFWLASNYSKQIFNNFFNNISTRKIKIVVFNIKSQSSFSNLLDCSPQLNYINIKIGILEKIWNMVPTTYGFEAT